MKTCAVCKRGEPIVTLKTHSNQLVCSSCKTNYYSACKKLVEVLNAYYPGVIRVDASTSMFVSLKCELQIESGRKTKEKIKIKEVGRLSPKNNTMIPLVNDLCKSCRFLIAADSFGYKIPEVTMSGLSMSRKIALNAIMKKVMAMNEIACIGTRMRKMPRKFKMFNRSIKNETISSKIESSANSSGQLAVSGHIQDMFLGENISDWSVSDEDQKRAFCEF